MTGFLEAGEVLEVVEVLEAAVEVAGGRPAFFLPPGSFLEVSSAFLEVLSCSVSESLSPTKRSLRLNLESGSEFKSLVALSNNFEASLVSEKKNRISKIISYHDANLILFFPKKLSHHQRCIFIPQVEIDQDFGAKKNRFN